MGAADRVRDSWLCGNAIAPESYAASATIWQRRQRCLVTLELGSEPEWCVMHIVYLAQYSAQTGTI